MLSLSNISASIFVLQKQVLQKNLQITQHISISKLFHRFSTFSQSLIPFRNISPQITSTKHITQITPDLSTKFSHLTYFLNIQYGEDIIFFGITNYHWQNKWHRKKSNYRISASHKALTLYYVAFCC